jgi:hypothetical protein
MLSPITDRLFLSQSALNGTIPSAIGCLTSLIQLNLEQQNLTGTIPTELLLLTKNGLFLCELIVLVALTASPLSQFSLTTLICCFWQQLIGPFTCPEFIEICGVSCGNVLNDQCRDLDEGETDEISGEMTTNLIEKVLPTDGG